MTDYTKLIERLDTELLWTLNYEAQDAIKALQAENERLKAEAETFKRSWLAFTEQMKDVVAERDALQAKLDELEKQEPRFWYDEDTGELYASANNHFVDRWTALYAAPKALAPSREVIGRYMADKGFYLSKEALDGLMLKLEGIGGTP